MKRQIVKMFSLFILVATLGLAGSLTSAKGQATRHVKAQIPFDFVVGDKRLSAGTYVVSPTSDEGAALLIQNATNKEGNIRLSNNIEPNKQDTNARLVFNRYGDTYFLVEVWRGGIGAGRRLLESRQEKAMKREEPRLSQNQCERIEIAATLN